MIIILLLSKMKALSYDNNTLIL